MAHRGFNRAWEDLELQHRDPIAEASADWTHRDLPERMGFCIEAMPRRLVLVIVWLTVAPRLFVHVLLGYLDIFNQQL